MTEFSVNLEDEVVPQDADFLETMINQYNIVKTGIEYGGDLALFVRDENGVMVGGLTGYTWGKCTEIKFLWVREDLRCQGYGQRLLAMAEQEARRRGCQQLYLDTYSFQAPDFYPKFGFEIYGLLENCPTEGYSRYFFRKVLN